MNPSNKHPALEAEITKIFGHDRRAAIEKNVCVPPPIGCGKLALVFRDEESRREFAISGLCQNCQDKIWKPKRKHVAKPTTPAKPALAPAGPNDYAIERGGMKCGQSEAQARRYRKYNCAKGVWLVADQPNAADNVYFHNPRDTKSDGFGGATLRFPLVEGGEYVAKGPWHADSKGLFQDTGVDVRATCLTFVVLSKGQDSHWPDCIMRDVVYKDADWTLGTFDRYKALIEAHPEANWFYAASQGGSISGATKTKRLPIAES